MLLPPARGPITLQVFEALRGPTSRTDVVLGPEPLTEDPDAQLALWALYELSYRGFADVADDLEWHPDLVRVRRTLESRFEDELRDAARGRLATVDRARPVDVELMALVERDQTPSVAAFLMRHATAAQMRDYLRERSVQQLRESDPQSFVLGRLDGAAKVALAELQYDEYGAGRPERLHQLLYARTLEASGLESAYAAYVTEISAISLANANAMSMFALNRRLRGAAMGHLAAFEASSSVPSRKVVSGLDRLGFAPEAGEYFDEHVEADAVHEHLAARDICGALVAGEPDLLDDVLFGAATCLHLEELSGRELLARWSGEVLAS